MIERFLKQTSFTSEEDYAKHLQFIIPENFNFAYDVMDVWAEEQPDKVALIWTDDEGAEKIFTFADLKRLSDKTAAYFSSLGIGHGDMVMIILKRRYEWWLTMLALHKLGAIAIPATPTTITAKPSLFIGPLLNMDTTTHFNGNRISNHPTFGKATSVHCSAVKNSGCLHFAR